MLEDDLCKECGLYAKSLLHLSMDCPKARETWCLTKFSHLLSSMNFQSFMDFLWYIVMVVKWSNEDVALAIAIVWALWTDRNEIRHGGLKKNGKQIFHWCTQYLDEHWVACVILVKKPQVVKQKWVPLIGLTYNVNMDGAWCSLLKKLLGWGW